MIDLKTFVLWKFAPVVEHSLITKIRNVSNGNSNGVRSHSIMMYHDK